MEGDDRIYKMTENEVYSIVRDPLHHPDKATTRRESGFSWKFCCLFIVTLITLNLILTIGTTATLFHHQSKISSDINQLRTGGSPGY